MYCKNCGKEIGDNGRFCEYCGAMVKSTGITNPNNTSISPQTVIEHLENAGVLEKRIYELDNLIKNITYRIKNLQTMREVKKEKTIYIGRVVLVAVVATFLFLMGYSSSMQQFGRRDMMVLGVSHFEKHTGTNILMGIVYALVPLICLIILLCKSFSIQSKYRNNIKIRDGEYRENLRKAEVLKAEKNNLIQKKKQAKQYLDMVYSKNILFPKYRNMIAVLTIQEYFMSGRCNCLTGHEGAYNIYESELRQNVIINSLEAIQYSLEQIKQNQYMLYQAIQDAQDRIDNLSYEFSNISSNVSSLENNSRVSAYNSKIAADNTRILSYIEMAKL